MLNLEKQVEEKEEKDGLDEVKQGFFKLKFLSKLTFSYFILSIFSALFLVLPLGVFQQGNPLLWFISLFSFCIYFIWTMGFSRYLLLSQKDNLLSGISLKNILIGSLFYFKNLKIILGLFLLNVVISLFLVGWTLLFILPGIVALYAYMFADFIKIESPELSIMDTIKQSRLLTDGYKLELFGITVLYSLCQTPFNLFLQQRQIDGVLGILMSLFCVYILSFLQLKLLLKKIDIYYTSLERY